MRRKFTISLMTSTLLLLNFYTYATEVSTSVLYEGKNLSGTSLTMKDSYSNKILIGTGDKKIPVLVTWSTGLDTNDCLRITHIKVERYAGYPNLKVDSVNYTALPSCGMEWESQDSTKFQTGIISMSYHTKEWFKTYQFTGSVAIIQGNGKFIKP
jgi:hypothetical protein